MMTIISDLTPFENINNEKHVGDNLNRTLENSNCACQHNNSPEQETILPGVCLVCPGLLLSGVFAGSAVALQRLRPSCVVCVAADVPDLHEGRYMPDCYLRIPILDSPDEDIHQHFDLVTDLIHQVRESGGRTLVHCVAGVSRSATLCLAYLMKYEGMNLRDSYRHLRSKRSQIRPNTGFFKQLIKYEEELFGQASVKMVYCQVIDKGIPDVYEPDYQAMTWYTKRYGEIRR